jgi:hypothetical protein
MSEVLTAHDRNFLKPEVYLNNIQKFSSYLTGNTLHLRNKDLPVNAV